jgi:hypothetical protein
MYRDNPFHNLDIAMSLEWRFRKRRKKGYRLQATDHSDIHVDSLERFQPSRFVDGTICGNNSVCHELVEAQPLLLRLIYAV